MNRSRRHFLRIATGVVSLTAISRIAGAQSYPSRLVRIVVGFAAGGPNDIVARLIGQWLSERLGQPFIVDNRPGASGNLAMESVVKASPDGYTLVMIGASSAVNATLFAKLPFVLLRDIAPVSSMISQPLVMLAHPSVPVRSIPELIAYAKANPGKLNMASPGSGTGPHMASELFKLRTSVNMVHVPYRGSAPMLTDLLAGQVQFAFDGIVSSIGHIKSGKLRALGVGNSARVEALPEVPAIGEFVAGYEASGWQGLGAPLNTPAEIIDKLNREIRAGLADPGIRRRLADLGAAPLSGSPDDFGRLVAEETEKWAEVVKFADIRSH
jgi:tripartite-type tricarboxylate transporter receptor subunit TctC